MNSHTIDAKTFQKLFLAGANRINSRKDYINELNVFPVPDGDTGTNMSLTILAAAKEVGALIAKRAAAKKITTVVYDRSGYIYHGVVKELAEAAREGGLEF